MDLGITLALIPTTTKGVSIGRRHYPGMQAFPNGPNSGTDVFVPMDWIIGGQERIGQGWRMLVTALAAGRGVMLPAMSVAGMKVATFSTGAYGRIREQFNMPVSRFEGVQEAAARIASDTYKMDAARRLTLAALDAGEKPAVISAVMKYHATEAMRRATNDAMDIHSGKAVIDGPRNYLSSAYRAIPIAITVEGANIMTRSLMIYGQGSIRCHPFIQEEIAAAQMTDDDAAVEAFDKVLYRHAAYTITTLVRAAWRAWTFGLLSRAPVNGVEAPHYRQIKRLSAALAIVSEFSMVTMGGALKRKEMISARLGDMLSHLFLACAALKRFADTGRPAEDWPLCDHSVRVSLNAADQALKEVIDNFPMRPVAWYLRLKIQPFGVICSKPLDRLAQKVSDTISEPTAARDRLTEGIYAAPDIELGKIDHAFRLMVELEPVRAVMRKARVRSVDEAKKQGLITGNEAARLSEAMELVREVSKVDDFAPEELTGKKPAARKSKAA